MSLTPVTVLLAVHNEREYIRPAIKSILEQTHQNFELLIVDDGSTDDTHAVISEFTDPRIRYVLLPHGGLSTTLNRGMQLSANPVIARMDADDIALPERLEKQLAVFTTLPESTVLGSRCLFFTNRHLWGYVNSPESHEAILKRMPLHNEFVHSCVMFNRDFVLRNGGYPTGIYGDFDLWLRLRDKAHFQIVPEPLLFIQYRKISLSRGNMLKQYRRVYALTRPFFADNTILHSFGLTDDEIPVVRGWREYFFGRPNLARYEWKRVLFQNGFKPRLLLAYLITFLPGPLFVAFKENRFRFRLDYFRILRREDRTRYKKLLRHFLN